MKGMDMNTTQNNEMRLADCNPMLTAHATFIRLSHFVPMDPKYSRWAFMYPLMSTLPNVPQPLITGGYVIDAHPTGVWSGMKNTPTFDTRDELLAWCEREGYCYGSSDIQDK